MLNKISETLKKYANGWLILVFLAGEMFFNAVILPNQQAKIEAAYGEAGRASYRTFELTGDIIYPIVYTLFFALLVTWLFQRQPDAKHERRSIGRMAV
jgi:hypothetical protein